MQRVKGEEVQLAHQVQSPEEEHIKLLEELTQKEDELHDSVDLLNQEKRKNEEFSFKLEQATCAAKELKRAEESRRKLKEEARRGLVAQVELLKQREVEFHELHEAMSFHMEVLKEAKEEGAFGRPTTGP